MYTTRKTFKSHWYKNIAWLHYYTLTQTGFILQYLKCLRSEKYCHWASSIIRAVIISTFFTLFFSPQEEELRKSGDAKYAHLSNDLHVLIEVFAPPGEAYSRMSHALEEIKKFLVPVSKIFISAHFNLCAYSTVSIFCWLDHFSTRFINTRKIVSEFTEFCILGYV